MNKLSYSDALKKAIKENYLIIREGWNGKGMFVYHVAAGVYPSSRNGNNTLDGLFPNNQVPYEAYLAIKTTDNKVVPWTPSQVDQHALDWSAITLQEYKNIQGLSEKATNITRSTNIQIAIAERVKVNFNDVILAPNILDLVPSTVSIENLLKSVSLIGKNVYYGVICIANVNFCKSLDTTPCSSTSNIKRVIMIKLPTETVKPVVKSSFNVNGTDEPLPSSVTTDMLISTIKGNVKYKHFKNSSVLECRIMLNNSYVSCGSVIVDDLLCESENQLRAYSVAFSKLWELFGYTLSMLTYCTAHNLDPLSVLFDTDAEELLEKGTTKFFTPVANKLTYCVTVLESGFAVTGESSCVNPNNYDAALGQKFAYENACSKLQSLHDFLQIDLAHYCTEI